MSDQTSDEKGTTVTDQAPQSQDGPSSVVAGAPDYERPTLHRLGTLADLTQGSSGGQDDMLGGGEAGDGGSF